MKTKELKATTQKSYYRKAFILEDAAGNVFLQSYNTVVAGIVNGVFKRFWSEYSVTTMNHINDFRTLYTLPALNKKSWLNLPVAYSEHVKANLGNQNYGCGCLF